ncbi:MAG: C1 family peptidase [Bacteroidia bacterium]|nr:C1 family peptidase [Bacteroidia bacterium]
MKTKIQLLFAAFLLGCLNVSLLFAQSPPQVDYREYQSPIRNQEGRGTCTAFAVVGAMEVFTGVPSDLSEQYIYAMAKLNHYEEMAEYDEGAPLSFYVDILQNNGTIAESESPYDPKAPVWTKDASKFEAMKADVGSSLLDLLNFQDYTFKLDNNYYTLRKGMAARDVAWIKQQLDQGVKSIPVGYAISGQYWFDKSPTISKMLHPADFLEVKQNGKISSYAVASLLNPNLALDIAEGRVDTQYTKRIYSHNEGHAVSIVGYNNQGFLIKNSWDTDWGENGYGWISYDYHKIYCIELLLIRSIKFARSLGGQDNVWNPRGWSLKVIPYHYKNTILNMNTDGAELSLVWMGEGRPEEMAEVNYRVLDANGNLVEESIGYVQGIFAGGDKMGYPAHLLDKKYLFGLSPSYTVEVTAKSKSGKRFTQRYYITGRKNVCYSPLGR